MGHTARRAAALTYVTRPFPQLVRARRRGSPRSVIESAGGETANGSQA